MKNPIPHKMYKDGKSVMAKTVAQHLKLKKEGYTHKAPKYNAGGIIHPNVKPDNREDLIVRYNKGGKAKSTVNSAGNYTKPTMRKRLFNAIKAGTKGGKAGQWSARKAQLLAVKYKAAGGGYTN
tara:strand:+ start:1017 stop:1388 length:372 start_codon:yes stop_codon:yes gene_type:complete